MQKKINFVIFATLVAIITITNVSALSYSSNTNLFENSYTNNLIDMANNQVNNFQNKYYVLFEFDYNYYLIVSNSKDYSFNNNNLTLNDTIVFSALRSNSGYNYVYNYSVSIENQSSISVNDIVISNIPVITNSVSSKRYSEYSFYTNLKYIGILLIGLTFAIFLTKERSYI